MLAHLTDCDMLRHDEDAAPTHWW